ncbi:hypothetical protein P7C70_g6825, partial [Phenoliferia sp. Uapishka_3]
MPATRSSNAGLKVEEQPGSPPPPPAEVEVKADAEDQSEPMDVSNEASSPEVSEVSEAQSDQELTGKTLLSLPRELLQRIGVYVAPEGGRQAGNLRLTCRRLAKAMGPVVWRSLCFDLPIAKLDWLLEAIFKDTYDMNEKVQSVAIRLSRPVAQLTSLALDYLPNLVRLQVNGIKRAEVAGGLDTLLPLPTTLAEQIPFQRLKTLHLTNVDLDETWTHMLWRGRGGEESSCRDMVSLTSCDGDDLFQMATEYPLTFVSDIVQINFAGATSSQLIDALLACRESVCDISITLPALATFSPTLRENLPTKIKDLTWALDQRSKYTLQLLGCPDLFRLSSLPTDSQRTNSKLIARLLNWVGGGPLYSLTLPVNCDAFDVHESLLRLKLPSITELCLQRNRNSVKTFKPQDMLHHASFIQLAKLVNPSSFPALRKLRLCG